MGGGTWTKTAFTAYSTSIGRNVALDGSISGDYSAQEIYRQHSLNAALNPYNVVRECCDSEEHPESFPVILALDVTGSMGQTAVEVAKKLNVIMTNLYGKVKDVEFMVMGIGDFVYDYSPLQVSQFESDIRIAEQLDKIWFEGHGGGNSYESYTAAWYFGAVATKLDCWKRGKKGIIITMGDECLNPYLPKGKIKNHLGIDVQDDIETRTVYEMVKDKYDLYHIVVDTRTSRFLSDAIESSWSQYLDGQHLLYSNVDNISQTIIDIVSNGAIAGNSGKHTTSATSEGISW